MAGTCDVCDKRVTFGRNIRHKHSGRWERKAPRTSRQFRPNIQSKRMVVGGRYQRVNICTRCLRTEMKHLAEGRQTVALAPGVATGGVTTG